MNEANAAKTITSKRGLKFLVKYDGDYVYIGLDHTLSRVGQICVYEAVKPLNLKCANRFVHLNGVYCPVFFIENNSIEEIEETLKNYSQKP